MKLTKLEAKVLEFMMNEKGHNVMPSDIDFITCNAYFTVMSNLDKKGMVIRKNVSFGTSSGYSAVAFDGYSITEYAVEFLK